MKRRRHKTKRNKNYIKIILPTFIVLVSILTIGYSAFQTNISLTAKGNIVEKPKTIPQILSNIEMQPNDSTVSGLYKDEYEENRYIYRGAEPNNYISLEKTTNNNNLYRIIAFNGEEGESNYSLKVMSNSSIGTLPYDAGTRFPTIAESRYSENTDDYCSAIYNEKYRGCNSWGSNTTTRDTSGNLVTQRRGKNLPDREAFLNIYLNNDWYNSIHDNIKKYIVQHSFYIGGINDDQPDWLLQETITQEKEYTWVGKIGLILSTDYIKASTSSNCTNYYSANNPSNCSVDNWLFTKKQTRTISVNIGNRGATVMILSTGRFYAYYDACSADDTGAIYPVFYLSPDLLLTGTGTETDPYVVQGFNKDTNS